jgi:hypothetical protein
MPLTLALQPGAGDGDGLGLGLGLGDGAGDGPVTVLGAVSFLLDPAQAGARSANVSSTSGAQKSRFIPRPYCISSANRGCLVRRARCWWVIRLQVDLGKALARGAHSVDTSSDRAHTRAVRTLSTRDAQYFRAGACEHLTTRASDALQTREVLRTDDASADGLNRVHPSQPTGVPSSVLHLISQSAWHLAQRHFQIVVAPSWRDESRPALVPWLRRCQRVGQIYNWRPRIVTGYAPARRNIRLGRRGRSQSRTKG